MEFDVSKASGSSKPPTDGHGVKRYDIGYEVAKNIGLKRIRVAMATSMVLLIFAEIFVMGRTVYTHVVSEPAALNAKDECLKANGFPADYSRYSHVFWNKCAAR